MNKITDIKQAKDSVTFIFNNDDKQFAVFTKFGKTLYTSTSPGILKSTLVEIKKDVKEFGFDEKILKKLWMSN
jgi:hypothetical protein